MRLKAAPQGRQPNPLRVDIEAGERKLTARLEREKAERPAPMYRPLLTGAVAVGDKPKTITTREYEELLLHANVTPKGKHGAADKPITGDPACKVRVGTDEQSVVLQLVVGGQRMVLPYPVPVGAVLLFEVVEGEVEQVVFAIEGKYNA